MKNSIGGGTSYDPMLYLQNENGTIKEYNVTGDNVFHYNLPEAQQHAVENYLNISSYPSYRLFDRQGNLLDVNADARNLDRLEDLLKKL